MKKVFSALVAVAVVLLLASCSLEFSNKHYVEKDGANYYTSLTRDICFVGTVILPEGATEFVIPDEVDGNRVISLGGLCGANGTPEPFALCPSGTGDTFPVSAEDIPSGAVVTEQTVVLKIGKYVESINAFPTGYFKVTDRDEYIRLAVRVECDSENEYFYSEDGRLYGKDGNEITYFDYAD